MHNLRQIRNSILTAAFCVVTYGGPALSCRQWVSTPGSAFEAIEPLRSVAMEADDSPANKVAARKKLADLQAAIKPGDALSYLKAGYWAAVLKAIAVSDDASGPELIRQAVDLRPNDPEYHFFAGLAYFEIGQTALYRKHWQIAEKLSKPNSAVARNLKIYDTELAARAR
jgi:Flp pilus assembly protein TadD